MRNSSTTSKCAALEVVNSKSSDTDTGNRRGISICHVGVLNDWRLRLALCTAFSCNVAEGAHVQLYRVYYDSCTRYYCTAVHTAESCGRTLGRTVW